MLRILLADDHPVVRRGLRVSLEACAGWQVCAEAADGREAVELALRERPDVAVMDLMMPGLNGLEATRLLRREALETEVLVFTFQHSEELAAEALAAGARGYLLKTDPPEDFVSAVEALSHHTPFFTRSVPESVAERVVSGAVNSVVNGRAARGGVLSLLTSRERQVLQLVAEGHRTRDIAEQLGISEKTVETHRTTLMRKLHLRTLADVVRYAIRNHVVQP